MNDSQHDSRNSSKTPADAKRAERAVRSSNISLADQRRSGRTLGFLGLSTVGHVAILVALASMPLAVHEINGGDNKPAGAGDVSMVDASASSATSTAAALPVAKEASTVDVSVMTDAASDVALSPKAKPEPKVEAAVIPLPEKSLPEKKQPTPKAVAKVATKTATKAKPNPVVATPATPEPVMTEESQDAPPVLLSNPPSDDEQETETAQAIAVPVVEEPPQRVESKEPTEEQQTQESTAAAESPAPVAAKSTRSEPESEDRGESAIAAPMAASASETKKSSGPDAGQSGQGQGGAVGAVAGPIRDASELKALNGNPNPVYPARDRLAHKEGTAVILGRVSPDGRIVEATIEKSSGSANMDAASIQAFRGWRFQAGQQGWVRKPFQFRLVGEAKEVPAPLGKGLKR